MPYLTETEHMELVKEVAALADERDCLLEALQELGDWLAYGLNKPDGAKPTADDLRRCQEVAEKARKAIEKARGEES